MIIDAVGGWQYPALGDICDVRDGTHDSPKYVEVGFPLITSKNLTEDGLCFEKVSYITQEDHDAIEKRSAVSDGDILYGMIGTVGNPVIVKKDRDFSVKNVAIFKFLEESLIFNKYLFYVLNGDFVTRQISKESKGGTQKFVSLKVLRGLKIPLPPLETQKQIVAVLEKADQLRKDCKLLEQELNSLAQSVFIDMFGDPVTNPKGWKSASLEKYLLNGPTNGLYKHADSYGSGAPIIRIDGFYNGKLNNINTFKRVEVTEIELNRYKIDNRGILINRVNSPQYLGKAAFIDGIIEDTVYESNMMYLTVDESRLNSRYLVSLLASQLVKSQIKNCSKDAVNQSSINQKDVKSFQILIPDIELQNRYERFLLKLDCQLQSLNKYLVELEMQFNSLMQKAFSGELKLDNAKN
ncbi:restriction endonuclease subunit S [Shewanella oncorhynchi]|uniref:restriction endonuclease subunit S n=1 Tax=Shewanella oncorhynchi TaxID=2726434 RepID=UPI003D792509